MSKLKIEVIVTRHQGLVDYIKEIGLVDENTMVLSHATVENIKNKIVCGVLPHTLSQHTALYCEIPLNLTLELRGKELSLEQIREFAGKPAWYTIKKIN